MFDNTELVGLSLSYSLSLNSVLFSAVLISFLVENKMVSVERIRQFTTIPSEAAWTIPDCVPSPTWPFDGNIELRELQVSGELWSCNSKFMPFFLDSIQHIKRR